MDPHNSDVHCGIDGGQGSLKVGITVTERTISNPERAHYSDVRIYNLVLLFNIKITSKVAKNSSVKKLLLLGVVPEIPENYFNIKAILSCLDIEGIEFTSTADIKLSKLIF